MHILHEIVEPVVTGTPPGDAHRDLMRLADGEIRHYGRDLIHSADGVIRYREVYAESRDEGLNWTCRATPVPSVGAMLYDSAAQEYWTILGRPGAPNADAFYSALWTLCDRPGIYLFRSKSPDGPYRVRRIWEEPLHIQRQPLILKKRKRLLVPFQCFEHGENLPGVLLSDDNGDSWRKVLLEPTPVPREVVWPHGAPRWQVPGCEPAVAETPSGKLIMLLRTAQDCFYRADSDDGGDTWTRPAPSGFGGTATMPNLVTLRDGRLLAVWNNTTPMPELDHELQPDLTENEKQGRGEDLFTNRDALHAALSDDGGQSWRGFRELYLNTLRNDADFRMSGYAFEIDKSVHQNQVLELDDGKILVAFGQHPLCRKFLVFDPAFLLAEERRENFGCGLKNWSVQLYRKGVNGMTLGYCGHCSANRQAGASLIPDPAGGTRREVLQIARHRDPRLWSDRQGAVWNFPAARRGELCLECYLPQGGNGLWISLCDRWFNASDEAAREYTPVRFKIGADGALNDGPRLPFGRWFELRIHWDLDNRSAYADTPSGTCAARIGAHLREPEQFSYLHLQSASETPDEAGVLVASAVMRRT